MDATVPFQIFAKNGRISPLIQKKINEAWSVFLALQILSANDCQGKIMINLVTTMRKRFLNS